MRFGNLNRAPFSAIDPIPRSRYDKRVGQPAFLPNGREPMSRRAPAILILAQYLLATVAGGLFHDHGAARGGLPPCGCNGHDRGAEPQPAAPAFGSDSLAADCHGPCPVCQFLSKKPIPAAQVAEPAVARLTERSVPMRPVLRPQPLLRTHLSRAPPAVA
jgi:hypothetical protein